MVEKLSSQDAGFLKLESDRCPFHVAGLMVFRLPENAPANFVRRLARRSGRMNELWPMLNKRLSDPDDLANAAWIETGVTAKGQQVMPSDVQPTYRLISL